MNARRDLDGGRVAERERNRMKSTTLATFWFQSLTGFKSKWFIIIFLISNEYCFWSGIKFAAHSLHPLHLVLLFGRYTLHTYTLHPSRSLFRSSADMMNSQMDVLLKFKVVFVVSVAWPFTSVYFIFVNLLQFVFMFTFSLASLSLSLSSFRCIYITCETPNIEFFKKKYWNALPIGRYPFDIV